MEGLDRDFLQQELVDRPVGTVHFSRGRLQATDAAPDDRLAAVVVPVDAPVKFAAVSAENHLCKTVIAGEAAFLTSDDGTIKIVRDGSSIPAEAY